MLPVAILAGGLATRMRPITETIPKSLIEISGKPFIFYQLEYLRSQGVKHVVLCVGFLGHMIEAKIGDGTDFGLHVSYSFDGPALLGTGGSLRQALPQLGEYFFVLYGDSFLPINYQLIEQVFFQREKVALLTVLKNNNSWDKSNVLFQDNKLLEYNKQSPTPNMSYIDYGLSILDSKLFNHVPVENSPFDLSDMYQKLSQLGQLEGYEVYDRFYEIGSFSGLKETEAYFMKREQEISICHPG